MPVHGSLPTPVAQPQPRRLHLLHTFLLLLIFELILLVRPSFPIFLLLLLLLLLPHVGQQHGLAAAWPRAHGRPAVLATPAPLPAAGASGGGALGWPGGGSDAWHGWLVLRDQRCPLRALMSLLNCRLACLIRAILKTKPELQPVYVLPPCSACMACSQPCLRIIPAVRLLAPPGPFSRKNSNSIKIVPQHQASPPCNPPLTSFSTLA